MLEYLLEQSTHVLITAATCNLQARCGVNNVAAGAQFHASPDFSQHAYRDVCSMMLQNASLHCYLAASLI